MMTVWFSDGVFMKRIKTFKSCWLKCLFLLLVFLSNEVCAIDLNSASREQLVSIKGIGLKTAENIIRERQRGGPFLSRQDLASRVKGIGAKRANKLFEAGLQIKSETLSDKALTDKDTRAQAVDRKERKRSLSAAKPTLIKPRQGNTDY